MIFNPSLMVVLYLLTQIRILLPQIILLVPLSHSRKLPTRLPICLAHSTVINIKGKFETCIHTRAVWNLYSVGDNLRSKFSKIRRFWSSCHGPPFLAFTRAWMTNWKKKMLLPAYSRSSHIFKHPFEICVPKVRRFDDEGLNQILLYRSRDLF